MPSIASLLSQIKSDYPQWKFKASDRFAWSDSDKLIHYQESDSSAYLFHEMAHASLGHVSYRRDIDLLKMERDAWDLAKDKIAPKYKVFISEDLVQSSLDTYRDWLHARSKCPGCSNTGFQTKQFIYKCPACDNQWRVNESRTCGLKRYQL